MSNHPSHNFFIAALAILLALSPFISLGVSYTPSEFAAAAQELLSPETLLRFIEGQLKTSIEDLQESPSTSSSSSEIRFDTSPPSQTFEFKKDFKFEIKGEEVGKGEGNGTEVIQFMRSAIRFMRALLDAFESFLGTFERLFWSQ